MDEVSGQPHGKTSHPNRGSHGEVKVGESSLGDRPALYAVRCLREVGIAHEPLVLVPLQPPPERHVERGPESEAAKLLGNAQGGRAKQVGEPGLTAVGAFGARRWG